MLVQSLGNAAKGDQEKAEYSSVVVRNTDNSKKGHCHHVQADSILDGD